MKRNRGAEIKLDPAEFPVPYDELEGSSPHTSESENDPEEDGYMAQFRKKARWAYWKSENALSAEISRRTKERLARVEPLPSIYVKALENNEGLTDDERASLRCQEDPPRKELADPDGVDIMTRYQLSQWSDPDALRYAIRIATGGAADSPERLYALAREEGGLARLSPAAKRILARNFWLDDDTYRTRKHMKWATWPGSSQATSLLLKRAGIDLAVLDAIVPYVLSSPISAASEGLVVQRSLIEDLEPDAAPTKTNRNKFGDLRWPSDYPADLTTPAALYFHEKMKTDFPENLFEDVKAQAIRRWWDLSEEEQEPYKLKWDKLRVEAWNLVEKRGQKPSEDGSKDDSSITIDLPGWTELKARQNQGITVQTVKEPERDSLNLLGVPSFPFNVEENFFLPRGLFWADMKAKHPGESLEDAWKVKDEAGEILRRYFALTPAESAPYEAWSELLRQEVWDEIEEYRRKEKNDEPRRLVFRGDLDVKPLLKAAKKPDNLYAIALRLNH
jgi:hypothetical protein